jgi:hypothetical protein
MKNLNKKQQLTLEMLVAGYRLRRHLLKFNNVAANDYGAFLDAYIPTFVAGLTLKDKQAVIPRFIKEI